MPREYLNTRIYRLYGETKDEYKKRWWKEYRQLSKRKAYSKEYMRKYQIENAERLKEKRNDRKNNKYLSST